MNTERLVNKIIADPISWLWSPRVQVELFALLPTLWDNIGPEERENLVRTICDGPPREMYESDLDEGEWQRIRDHSVWERLARLQRAENPLPDNATERLAQLDGQYPEWELSGEDREDFPIWTESGWGHRTDLTARDLKELENETLLEHLTDTTSVREGRLAQWEAIAREDPRRAIRVLNLALEKEQIDKKLLFSSMVGVAGGIEPYKELIAKLIQLVNETASDLWDSAIHPLSRATEEVFKLFKQVQVEAESEAKYDPVSEQAAMSSRESAEGIEGAEGPDAVGRTDLMELWDTVRPLTLDKSVDTREADRLTEAINHPTGHLTHALLHLLDKDFKNENGFNTDIQDRFQQLIREEGQAGRAAQVILCSRLDWLYELDPEWVEHNLIPLFNWGDPNQASVAWQGYLWGGRPDPELWMLLRPHFFRAFEFYDQLGRKKTGLAELLLWGTLRSLDASGSETRNALESMDDAGRRRIAKSIADVLKGAGDRAAKLWSDKIGPWLEAVWPRDRALCDPDVTIALTHAVAHVEDEFPEAVETVKPLFQPLNDPHHSLKKIAESDLPERYPEEVLQLMDALTAADARPFGDLFRDVLNRLEAAEVEQTNVMRRLRNVAERS